MKESHKRKYKALANLKPLIEEIKNDFQRRHSKAKQEIYLNLGMFYKYEQEKAKELNMVI